MQYDYKIRTYGLRTNETIESVLDNEGKNGWRLVAVIEAYRKLIFERQIDKKGVKSEKKY